MAQIKQSGIGRALTAYGSITMPLGATVEGEIIDPTIVSLAIKNLWRSVGLRSKEVSIGVSNQKVIVRLIDLPFMDKDELAGAIQYQAQDYIPIPVEDAVLDFQILGDYMTPSDEHMMEVLLVAAQRDMIANVVAAVEGAGLRLASIDVTAFALVRALLGTETSWLATEFNDPSQALGVVHISSGLTTIVVLERGIPRFTRVSSLAGNQMTQAVATALNITFDEAEAIKIKVGLPSMDGTPTIPEGVDPAQAQAAQETIEREAGKLIAEIRRSFDYYLTQANGVHGVQKVYLTGNGALMGNLPAYMEKGLQAEVCLGDPLAHVQIAAAVEHSVVADRMGCAASIGLALGGTF